MLDFELNDDDKTQIRNLKKTLREKYDKNRTKDNLDTLMRDYFEKIEMIYSKAHKRALNYYETHQDEILCALKKEIKNYATFLGSLDNSLEKINKAIDPLETQEQKNSVIIEITPYLEILKSNAPQDYEEIISFIDYAFDHREDFYEEERELIRESKKKNSPPIKTRTIRSKELKLDRSKPNKAIRDGQEELYSTKGLDVETGRKKNKPIYTPVLLNFVNEELEKQGLSIDGIGHLDAFDAEILMHAESLYEAGNKIITVDMITSQIAGGNRRVQTTPKMKEEIYKSLKRLRLTNITINTENEQKVGYNKHIIFSGALLPNKIESEPAIINGKRIEEYIHIFDASPLSKYADSKNQISRPPVNMLDVPASLTRENVILVGYLARRIVDMQSPDEWRGKYIIRYDTIFEYMKVESNSPQMLRNKKNKIRETVRAILEEWKKKGIIKDFQELGEDNKTPKSRAPIAKIKITLPQKKIESAKNNQ